MYCSLEHVHYIITGSDFEHTLVSTQHSLGGDKKFIECTNFHLASLCHLYSYNIIMHP